MAPLLTRATNWVAVTHSSFESLSLGTQSGRHHRAVNNLNVGDLAHNHGPVLLLGAVSVNGVTEKEDVLKVSKLRALCNFFPVLNLVVRDEESVELLEGSKVVQSLDLVVAEPELLERGGHILQVLDPLDVVAGQRENFQALQALHRHDLDDGVRRQGKLLAVLELVDLVVKLLKGLRDLADQ